MNDLYEILFNKNNKNFLMGTVYSLSPFKITLFSSDTPIHAVKTSGVSGASVGSRVLLVKFNDEESSQLIAIAELI
ncbi:MAG: hypothetical protein EH224_15130 [Calditrichaeota bacterium]|nr:MAG: hypothetical protein EH224_15130 [Calditrichota bacterium]